MWAKMMTQKNGSSFLELSRFLVRGLAMVAQEVEDSTRDPKGMNSNPILASALL